VVVRGEPRSCRPLFIGAERRFGGRFFELGELRQWWFGKVLRGLRPAGFAVNPVLLDTTRRAGELAAATCSRTTVVVVLEGTTRAGPLWRPQSSGVRR
jgi:hypothetical protein